MRIIDLVKDQRLNCTCATVTCSYKWYLDVTAGAEDNLKIQRHIIRDSKAYRTLRTDLRKGCILPPVVLAMSDVNIPAGAVVQSAADVAAPNDLIAQLQPQILAARPDKIYIIDGLQRTNALRETRDGLDGAEKEAFLNHSLRAEIWLNIPFRAIAYRMLLLNAGQKPMSIKHQVEILSNRLSADLQGIPHLRIQRALGAERRTQPGDFTLAKLAQAFQAWLQGSPNIDVRNTVMEQLLGESALDTLGTSLAGQQANDEFREFVRWLVEMDTRVFPTEPQFFGNETVILGIAAAVGAAQRNESLRSRMKRCLETLSMAVARDGAAVLAVSRFNDLRQGEDVRRVNVGQFTREMVYRAFQEFFLADGTKTMEECWTFGAQS